MQFKLYILITSAACSGPVPSHTLACQAPHQSQPHWTSPSRTLQLPAATRLNPSQPAGQPAHLHVCIPALAADARMLVNLP